MVQSVSSHRVDPGAERPSRVAWIAAAVAGAWMLVLELGLGRHGPFGVLVASIGRFHPLIVHVPIGVLLLLALSELAALRGRGPLLGAATGPTLWLAALGALGAFTAGFVLSHEGGYEPGILRWHERLAAGVVIGAFVSLGAWTHATRHESAGARRMYQLALAATLLLLTAGAHLGGSLSHGPSFLTENLPAPIRRLLEPSAPPTPSASSTSSTKTVFVSLVQPLLEKRCTGCHGTKKSKGGLRLDSLAAIRKGGEHGRVVVPGNAAKSPMFQRLVAALDDERHMPPESKPQPTSEEISLLRTWIDTGAQDAMPVADFPRGGTASALLPRTEPSASSEHEEPAPQEPQGAAPASTGATTSTSPSTSPTHADIARTNEPEPSSVPDPPATGPEVDVWARVIQPIFAARCGNCHGPVNHKGKLRLDDYDAALHGGAHGRVIVPGKPGSSKLIQRVFAPSDDDDHMPPSSRAQPSAAELSAIRWWINKGAPRSAHLAAGELPNVAPSAAARSKVAAAPTPAPGVAAPSALAQQSPGSVPNDSDAPAETPGAAPAAAPAEVASGRMEPTAEADAGAGRESQPTRPSPERPPPGCGCALDARSSGGASVAVIALGLLFLRRRSARIG